MRPFYVYILANRKHGTIYVGMTDDLSNRLGQHWAGVFGGFTAKYGIKTLVWYETHETREGAFIRERQIKKWKRTWKIELIEAGNPDWSDLAPWIPY